MKWLVITDNLIRRGQQTLLEMWMVVETNMSYPRVGTLPRDYFRGPEETWLILTLLRRLKASA